MSVMNTVRYGEQTYLYDIEGEQLLLSDLLYEGYREEKESCGEREREEWRERGGETERERRGEGERQGVGERDREWERETRSGRERDREWERERQGIG